VSNLHVLLGAAAPNLLFAAHLAKHDIPPCTVLTKDAIFDRAEANDMRRLTIAIWILCGAALPLRGQGPGSEIAPTTTPLEAVELALMPVVDNQALLEAELDRRAPDRAPRFAEAFAVDIRPETHGHWETLPDGRAVWRLRIQSPAAYSLNFGFREYYLPPGGKLLIYAPEAQQVMGPFTPADNEDHDQLWTPILEGDVAVLEVQIPAEQRPFLRLRLSSVNHDFLGFAQLLTTGTCHLDVICGASNGWGIVDQYREAIRSVAVYGLGGDTFCTGFLVNNTRQDCRPYFVTAYHCEVTAANAPSLVAYWDYQNSFCRQIGSLANGSPGNGQLNLFNTGAIWRAAHQGTDFTLLELDDPIPPTAQAFFAGWSRETTPPQDTVACVHHPNGAEKRISFSFQNTYAGAWGSGSTPVPTGNHLIVPSWNVGSTASGSSGGPLFNRQQRIVGQLHGGAASCNNNQYDAFGWFRYAWTGGGTPTSRLRDWLAPDADEPLVLDGRRLSVCTATVLVESPAQTVCLPGSAFFTIQTGEAFTGPVNYSATGLPPSATAAFSPNPAPPGSTVALTVTFSGSVSPAGTVSFVVVGQHGSEQANAPASFNAVNQLPAATAMTAPGDGAAGLPLAPVFNWNSVPQATSYDFQLATDSAFIDIFTQQVNLSSTTYTGIILAPISTYYCRARARNACGPGPWSPPSRLTTAAIACAAQAAADTPKTIPAFGTPTIHSEIVISEPGTVASIRLRNLNITHSYVGDLSAFLRSPSGKVVHLFHRPGFPIIPFGCWGSNLRLDFDDTAPKTQAELENTCSFIPPAIQGSFQPITPLASLIGEPMAGTWRLTIIDHQDLDGGQLEGWQLDFCRAYPALPQLFQVEETLSACQGQTAVMEVYVGAGFQAPVALQLNGLPPGAAATFSSNPAQAGQMVTITLQNFLATGSYPLSLTALDGVYDHAVDLQLEVSAPPTAPWLVSPPHYATLSQDELLFQWAAMPDVDTFQLEIARDLWFEDLAASIHVTDTSYRYEQALPQGTYHWRVTAFNRCSSQASKVFSFFKDDSVTSSQEMVNRLGLKVFPNPARDELHLLAEAAGTVALQATLFTLDGQLLQQATFRGRGSLDVRHLPRGIYILALTDGEQFVRQRVLLQ
jgi:subtilisin-like proprotein convertase family protein